MSKLVSNEIVLQPQDNKRLSSLCGPFDDNIKQIAMTPEYIQKVTNKKLFISKGFDYNGLNYQIDDTSRLNITGKALALQLDPTIETVSWISNTKDDEGNDIRNTFTREEFVTFAKEVAKYYESIVLGTV